MASGKFTWRIDNFSERQSERIIYSDVFTVGGCNWCIMLYPKGFNDVDCMSLFMKVANKESLPSRWSIDAKYSMAVVNQLRNLGSTKRATRHKFTAQQSSRGWRSFKSLTELHDSSKGYLVNDTLVVEAGIEVVNVSPPTVVLEISLSNMNKFITDASQGPNSAGSSANVGMKSEVPSLEEVEMAKKSLEECLSDIFKLNIRERLAKSLETLSRAEIGLSSEEQRAVQLFWGEFDDFVADFLTFEQENSEFELHKLAKDQLFHSIKKMQETHVSKKRRLDHLTKEEEEHKKKMEEAKSSKATLISEWETLMNESEAKKSEYKIQEKKLREAEERKRIAEERMSRSSAAWSSLKLRFAKKG